MADVILSCQGTVDEFVGDAILAIFGAPLSRPDDAHRAVACAVRMQEALLELNRKNASEGLPRLEMGIAVHTGEVIVGNIGSERRTKYGVVGSAVNHAGRIESFRGAALRSGTLLIACALLLAGAGVIEGYVSPNPRVSLPARITIGVGYWCFMVTLLTGWLWGRRARRTRAS